jgi:hypothetical protein
MGRRKKQTERTKGNTNKVGRKRVSEKGKIEMERNKRLKDKAS